MVTVVLTSMDFILAAVFGVVTGVVVIAAVLGGVIVVVLTSVDFVLAAVLVFVVVVSVDCVTCTVVVVISMDVVIGESVAVTSLSTETGFNCYLLTKNMERVESDARLG